MATFSSSISEVINGKGNKASKMKALVSVFGLRPVEAEMAYSIYYEHTPIAHRESFKYTFGVEIECLFKQSGTFASLEANGVHFTHSGYYHHTDNEKRNFDFKTDSSIRNTFGGMYSPIEMVSPILNGKGGFKDLENACKSLNDNDAKVNKSTGLHVHIGVKNLSDEAYVNVFKNYQRLEALIDTFMAESRRGDNNHYCHTLQGNDYSHCVTKADVRRANHYDRYYKVNAESWLGHSTIEFRHHAGSTDYEKISKWVNFCAKLVQWSRKNTFLSDVTSIDEIPFLNAEEKSFFKGRQQHFAA